MRKKTIVVLFGGESSEHDVSINSASFIVSTLNSGKYDVLPIAISKTGKWLSIKESIKLLELNNSKRLMLLRKKLSDKTKVDVVFPIFHGLFGEDGTIQGMLDLIGVPYVGSGVMASAIGINKSIQKRIFENAGIQVIPWISFSGNDWQRKRVKLIGESEKLNYPIFIKPNDLGSSIGITKAHNQKELIKGIDLALSYSEEVVIEQGIDAREIECSILGNEDIKASVLGEILPSREFYSYEAKYADNNSGLIIPAKLSKKVTEKIQATSIKAFKIISASGMARVDFLINKKNSKIYLNEINTIPGFTEISMYPKLWVASGAGYSELLDKLISLAIDRSKKRKRGHAKKLFMLCDIYRKTFF